MLAFYYYPQWIWICLSRFLKLYIESLKQFPFKLRSIYRIVLVTTLAVLALLVSLIHLTTVFVEQVIFGFWTRKLTYNSVFIVGAPRSGTTRTHKLMALNTECFTAMQMWELFFAPSIIQKRVLKIFGKIDKRFGKPLYTLICTIEKRAYSKFNNIHALSLFNIEEDALILYHLFSCYHLSFLLGKESSYSYLNYNKSVPKAVWAYYKICIDNHMLLHKNKTYLSKNPFYSGSTSSLKELFGKVKFIHMERNAKEVIPSFFSLKKHLSFVFYGIEPTKEKYREIQNTVQFWAESTRNSDNNNIVFKGEYLKLKNHPEGFIQDCFSFIGVPLNAKFQAQLKEEAKRSKNYKSNHKYSASEFKLQ